MSRNNKIKTIKTEGSTPNKIKLPNSMSLNRLNPILDNKISKGYKYDSSLFHKTSFHLRPLLENPELYTQDLSLSSLALDALKYKKIVHQKAVLPHPVNVKMGLQRLSGGDKVLRNDTMSHVTAKKWLIYNMQDHMVVKGYKHRVSHDVASLSKLLTFYTVYDIVQQNFIVSSTFEILVLPIDHKVGGTMLNTNKEQQYLINLQDALYALLLASANNIAVAIANNLGSYLNKQRQGKYFSCFDLASESRDANVRAFMSRMKLLANKLGLKDSQFTNSHGAAGNYSSAVDMAKLAAQCFKIPLFSRISTTKRMGIKAKNVDEEGNLTTKTFIIQNTNKLLGRGCVGGKTGSNIEGGESFLGAFAGSMLIVVLGSAGREERFHDCMRLAEWVTNKLQLTQNQLL